MPNKDSDYKKLVGRRLAAVRDHLEYETDRALAEDLKVHEDRLNKWLLGHALFPPLVADRLFEMSGVNLNFLYSSDPKRITPEFFPMKKKVPARE